MLKPLFHNKKTIISIIFALISLSVLGFSVIVWADNNKENTCIWRLTCDFSNKITQECESKGCPGCTYGSCYCSVNFDNVSCEGCCANTEEEKARPRLYQSTQIFDLRIEEGGGEHASFEEQCCAEPKSSYMPEYVKKDNHCVPKTTETVSGNYLYETTHYICCLLYTSPSPRDGLLSRMPSSA